MMLTECPNLSYPKGLTVQSSLIIVEEMDIRDVWPGGIWQLDENISSFKFLQV